MSFLAFLSFLLSVGLFISWCVLVSRVGQIRDEARKQNRLLEEQTTWLKHNADLQKRQTDALQELVDQRTQDSSPPVLAD